jgi:Flp pilus assembly protein TadB
VDLAAMLPAIVVLHGIVLVAIALVLARVLPRYFQRRQRDQRPHRG